MEFYLPEAKDGISIAVAMSGGVDSSVVAAMLVNQGYNVKGITLAMQATIAKEVDELAIKDAKEVCKKLNIEHHVANLSDEFRAEIIQPFADSYLNGETPLPCASCNKKFKFGYLWQAAKELGCDYLITGHYINWQLDGDDFKILQGDDKIRDQSYFLSLVNRDLLKNTRFPLGSLSKDETREYAKEMGLNVHNKPDSQDICFVPNGRYIDIIEKLHPNANMSGDIVHIDGRILGKHEGTYNFTIGQRKGIGIGGAETLYVIKLDAKNKQVIVGPKEALQQNIVYIKDLNWVTKQPLQHGQEVLAKVRAAQELTKAKIYIQNDGLAKVVFDEAISAVAPGQLCAFYKQTQLLGGGWIIS